jgi:metal-sulfur cluster biosynthetic enzyme
VLEALAEDPSPSLLRELLHEVIDPELGLDIVELGLLRDVTVEDRVARVRFTVTTPACPLSSYIEQEIRACLIQLPGLAGIEVACEYDPPWTADDMSDNARVALGWSS